MQISELFEIQKRAGLQLRCATYSTEHYCIHIYFVAEERKEHLLNLSEAKILNESKRQNIGRGMEIVFDQNKTGFGGRDKDHLHLLKKGNELLAINRDGTAHDGYHKTV